MVPCGAPKTWSHDTGIMLCLAERSFELPSRPPEASGAGLRSKEANSRDKNNSKDALDGFDGKYSKFVT